MIFYNVRNAISKTTRQILDELTQLEKYITIVLPTGRVIVSRVSMRSENGKFVTLSNLNKDLEQLEAYFFDNANIREVHLGKKDLHLNKNGKDRLKKPKNYLILKKII